MCKGPDNSTPSSPADYIRYFESVLRIYFGASSVYIRNVHALDECVEFVVMSDIPLDFIGADETVYPVLVEKDEFHVQHHPGESGALPTNLKIQRIECADCAYVQAVLFPPPPPPPTPPT